MKQVQRWLGHHSASFTLDTYIHLLDGDLGGGLSLPGCEQECEPEAHHPTTSVKADSASQSHISGEATPQHTPA
ncbi:MAG: hypothetical protein ACHQTF_11090 [Gemmatimonadales bacterium]